MRKAPAVKNVFIILLFISFTIFACGKGGIKTEMDKVSYSIGTQIGQNFKMNGVQINSDILVRAIEDVMNDRDLALTQEEMTEVMTKFQEDLMARRQQEMAEQNRAEASSFLAENASKQGITTLPDSLQYEVIEEGTGPVPKATDTVKIHYRGTLIDGTEFDSSYSRNQPAEFPVNGVINGWTEVLQLMKTGSKWKVYIPPELGYRERGYPPNIPPNALLIFEIELLEIVK